MKAKILIITILATFCVPMLYSENHQSSPKIGYTTNYGNSFGQTTNSYQATYPDVYNSINYNFEYDDPWYVQDDITKNMAKAPDGEHVAYQGSVTVDGVTVIWEITGTDIFGIGGRYKIYVDGVLVDSGWMWASEAQRVAQEKAKEVAEEKAHSFPIGSPIIPMAILSFIYALYAVKLRKLFLKK